MTDHSGVGGQVSAAIRQLIDTVRQLETGIRLHDEPSQVRLVLEPKTVRPEAPVGK